jgi:uncharacterized protein (DUF849 family)
MGDHARVGCENNLQFVFGGVDANHISQAAAVPDHCLNEGRHIVIIDQARMMLGVGQRTCR